MNLFKSVLLLIVLMFLQQEGKSQQTSLTNQYILAPGLINPSLISSYKKAEIFQLIRKQWSDVSGAPSSQIFTLNGSLKKNKTYIGTTIIHDKIGLWRQLSFYGNFAYRLKLKEETFLDFGIGLGGVQRTFDFNNVQVRDIEDPNLVGGALSNFSFDASFGIGLMWKKLKFGLSSYQLLGNQIAYKTGNKNIIYKLNREFRTNLSYKFTTNSNLSIIPIVTTRYNTTILSEATTPLQYDINLLFDAAKLGWFFVSYKSDYAIALGVGGHINKSFHFGVSYDLPVFTTLKSYLGNTTEITFRYTLKNAGRSSSQFLY